MDTDVAWLDTNDGRCAYHDVGSGDPVILLHGGLLDHRMWDEQIPILESRYRVVAPDARGHGASANASRPFRHADDVAALLFHLDIGPAVIAGLSMGAGIAVDTALEYPHLVRALVVSGAGTSEPEFTDPWTVKVLSDLASSTAVGDAESLIAAFALFAAGPRRTLDDLDPGVVRRVREMARRTVTKHTVGEPDWLIPVRETWTRAAKINVPVLAINGDLDAADHIAMAERLARTVADGNVTTIEGTAHYPNMERPGAFNQALTGFLATLPPAAPRATSSGPDCAVCEDDQLRQASRTSPDS
jgi:pimeloyl-ACP methyl ester carboxylesterase